jgi:hypothetical protein
MIATSLRPARRLNPRVEIFPGARYDALLGALRVVGLGGSVSVEQGIPLTVVDSFVASADAVVEIAPVSTALA